LKRADYLISYCTVHQVCLSSPFFSSKPSKKEESGTDRRRRKGEREGETKNEERGKKS